MSRINTNIPSLTAQRVLNANNRELNTSLTRLSTGLKINTGKDDPAGLIASETLRAEKVAISAALTNISRADNVIATAEGGLAEINSLLLDLEDLIDRSSNEAGISEEERNANQVSIDSILESIDRFANTTEFQGRRLLSGELDYSTSSVTTSQLGDVRVNSAKIPQGGTRTVVVEVLTSAGVGSLAYAGATAGSGAVTVEIVGNIGTEVITFASGATVAEMVAAINQSTDLTGVSAIASGVSGMRVTSTEYGSSEFVSINVIDDNGSFASGLSGTQDYGEDASITINGVAAITDGLTASMRTGVLSVDIDLTEAFGTQTANSATFYVTGGGADFMISPTVSTAGQISLGIQSVTTGNLGSRSLGYLSTLATGDTNALNSENYSAAQRIVREAQQQVSFLRGRLGAFQTNTLETTANALEITYENTTAAESIIRETDFAAEAANLTRSQILVQAATSTLAMANANPQNVLALLG
ncbi:MAG: flagellin [Phycisphaerae bacterium]|nr:flagellin [Phycisphaerae bacterium]